MNLIVPAIWTDDCQGKKDFDGELVKLTTRYWPRGGGFVIINNGIFQTNEARPSIKPSAHAKIYLGSTHDEFYDDAILLTKIEVEAETEEEVRNKIENWASIQYKRIASVLLKEFEK